MWLRILLPAALFACLAAGPASGQSERFNEAWRWVEFTTESGLPSNRVIDVVETGDSTVWAVTASGLAWYDGFRWNRVDSSLGLTERHFESATRYGRNGLLLLSGRTFYAGGRNGFTTLPLGPASDAAPLPPDGLLFVRKSSIVLLRGDRQVPFTPGSALTEGKTISLWDTKGGHVWADLFSGLYRFESGEWKLKIAGDFLPRVVSFLAENERGTGIAYLTYPDVKRGLWEWRNGGTPVRNESERPDNVRSADIGDDDEAIVAYKSGDVKLRTGGAWSLLPLMNPDVRDISIVKFRSNHDLWIGTDHGLFLYKRSASRWRFFKHESPDLRNYANELLASRSGDLWVATSDGIEVHPARGPVRYIAQIDSRPLNVVTGLGEDSEGGIWISSGSSFDGAYRWDGSRWTHFDVNASAGGVRFHKIRKDREGRLWFLGVGKNVPGAGQPEPGAFLLAGGSFIRWGENEGLVNGRVYAFAEGKDGSRWFGTGAALCRWKPLEPERGVPDPRRGTWTRWTYGHGLNTARVFTIAIDSGGRVWFGDPSTLGVGVGYVDANDTAHYMTVADGLVNDYIWDLRVDTKGKLWVATGDGLCSYAEGRWSTFDRMSGLGHSILWPVLPLDTEVCAGTQGGGIAFLNLDASRTPEPRIELDPPTTEGANLLLRWRAYAFWGELDPSEIITRCRLGEGAWSAWSRSHEHALVDLKPGEYTYQVQARGLFGNYLSEGVTGSFTVPLPMVLRPAFLFPTGTLLAAVIGLGVVMLLRKRNHDLALRKSEEKFRTVTEMTSSAIFIHRDFHLLFVNSGAENLTGFTQSELVAMSYLDLIHPGQREEIRRTDSAVPRAGGPPHRYEARLVTHTGEERWADCTSGWMLFQGSHVRLTTAFDITERKKAEAKLRSLASELSMTEERERRRMATYLHDVIGQTLALSKLKIRSLQKPGLPASHLQPLEDLRDLIDQSITNTQTLTFELCPPILYELSFDAAIGWLTERMAGQHGIAISFRGDPHPHQLSDEVKVLLFHAVREVLVNVIKHASAGRAAVELSHTNGSVRIDITDDGIGFDASRKAASAFTGGGFGLFNIRERLTYLGGSLEIGPDAGSGTRVSIIAPVRAAGA